MGNFFSDFFDKQEIFFKLQDGQKDIVKKFNPSTKLDQVRNQLEKDGINFQYFKDVKSESEEKNLTIKEICNNFQGKPYINLISNKNYTTNITIINNFLERKRENDSEIIKHPTNPKRSDNSLIIDNLIFNLNNRNSKEFIRYHFRACLKKYTVEELKCKCKQIGFNISGKNKSDLMDMIIEPLLKNGSKCVSDFKNYLNRFKVDDLKDICRSIGLTYSSKNKDELIHDIGKILIFAHCVNYTDIKLKELNLEDFNIDFLKEFLRSRGGKVSGNKDELIKNLKSLI